VALLPQPWLHRWCHRHGLLPRFSASWPVSSIPSLLFLCSCLGGLASEPGMLAYCCCTMLDLVMLSYSFYLGHYLLLLLASVQDSVKTCLAKFVWFT
jgi:hypothetical protein